MSTVSLHTPRPARTGSIIGIALVLVVAAAAIGRFLTTSGPAPVAPATGAAPDDPIARLEAQTAATPDDATAWYKLANEYVAIAPIDENAERYEQAEAALAKAEALAPNDPGVMLARGNMSVAVHEFEQGWQQLSAIPADQRTIEWTVVAIDAATETGRYDEALSLTQQLLDQRPDASALARASYQRELRGDLGGALDLMMSAERAAGTPTQRAVLAAFVGHLELSTNRLDAAAESYARSLALEPDLVIAQRGNARAMAAQGRLDEAIAFTETVMARNPQAALSVLQGQLLTLAGRTAEAKRSFELAAANDIELTESGVVVDLESALFQADHGDPALALDFAIAGHDARQTVFTADALAWARFVNGDTAGAIKFLDEALALGAVDAPLRVHAALIAAAAGDDSAARRHLEVAFESTPWTTIASWDEALDLAEELQVAVPAAWIR